jgi:hypothetical protein
MCRFSINIELKGAIWLAEDGEVEHVDLPVFLTHECPLDVGVDIVEEVEEGVNMVAVDGCHGVVRLTKPEQDDARGGRGRMGWLGDHGSRGRWLVHVFQIRSCRHWRGAVAVAHGAFFGLGIVYA